MTTIEHVPGVQLPETLTVSDATARWSAVREFWMPVTTVLRDADGTATGAALTMARPGTSYRKIVDVIATNDADHAALLDAVIALSGDGGDDGAGLDGIHPATVVHYEQHGTLAAGRAQALAAAGFVRQAAAVPSVPSTLAGLPGSVEVWSRWVGDAPTRRIPYYGQTTDVTCGAVTALGAMHAAGHGAFTVDRDDNHSIELGFWRLATNLPACEPIGLAVAARDELAGDAATPRVIVSTERPVLLEEYADKPGELRLREDLQAEARRRADLLGVPVEYRWVDVDEIAALVRGGSSVGILIDLMPLINDPSPHWILAYDVIGDDVIVSDPWVDSDNAETWADTFALPLPPTTLDLIARWGDPVYRGVVVFAPVAAP
ncbi:peptidase C39 family protein [Microbacterium sp.]|uniref:peptidase C39 family protein n=1 Tax=Microbacterium sp. TaxID=51671 RepID=UPI003A938647